MATIKLDPKAKSALRDPFRKPVRAATAPRVHQGQGPKKTLAPSTPDNATDDQRPRTRPRRDQPAPPAKPARPGITRTLDASQLHRAPPAPPHLPGARKPSAITRDETLASPALHNAPDEERISKRLATLGLASRREADAWIEAGWVRVNGHVATLGEKVAAGADIQIDPRARAHQTTKVTILLHKPLDVVSGQAEDGHTPAAALILRATRWANDRSERRFESSHADHLAPAGRLDMDSTGLLVLTQDGRIAKQLIGESAEMEKEYIVHVDWRDPWAWSDQALERLRHGLMLDDVALRPAAVERLRTQDRTGVLRFVLKEGRKRQIRRMCDEVGLRVTQLVRVRIGRLKLGDLPLGQWRFLRDEESF